MSLPVLNQKWAILFLLYQLADSPDPDEPLPLTPLRHSVRRDNLRRRAEQDRRSKASTPEAEAFEDAFGPGGLKRFPPEQARRGPEDTKQVDGHDETSKRDVSLKSTLLADNYLNINPSETSLLRDLPFTLQG